MSTSDKVLFLGLDGATFTVLDPLMRRGVMPFLRDFVQGGVRGRLRSILPPLTPPAWTSLMTGKRPGEHGVFDFLQKEEPDSRYFRMAASQNIGAATVWSMVSEQGGRVTALNFPLMFPPPAVNGSVVPGGWMPWRQLRLGCYPPGLFDRLKQLPGFNAREMALDMAQEAKAIEGCDEGEYVDWITLHTRREQRWFEIMRYLMSEEPAQLSGIVFDGVDKLQHQCWRFLDPALRPAEPTAWEQEVMGLCDEYFRQLDAILAALVEQAGPGATVIMGSDHGFGPTSDIAHLNSWLEREGYLAWSEESAPRSDEADLQLGFAQMTRHVYQLDWERTRAYVATPSSQGVHIVRERPDGSRLSDAEYQQLRDELVAKLRALINPATGKPLAAAVQTREEVYAGPFDALEPDIYLALEDGATISILRSDEVFHHRPEPKGNHRWDGIFLARGPLLRAGACVEDLSLLDIAPLMLYSLDLAIPSDLSGRLPEDALLPGVLERRPPRLTAPSLPDAPSDDLAPGAGLGVEDEAAVVRRLRALGYVE